MTRQMERNKKTTLLLLLLAALQVCSIMMANCPNNPDTSLDCYTDYNKTITCVWNSTYKSEHTDATCTLHATKIRSRNVDSASCVLDPAHVSRPALRNCSLNFEREYAFQSFHLLSINLSCDPAKNILSISYKPSCHIKLNPPGQPSVNVTTVSWVSKVTGERIKSVKTELQWKRWDQSWSDPAVQTKTTICAQVCETQLDTDLLVLGERHEARSRVQAYAQWAESTWSDWSPTASWSSPVGITRQPSLPPGLSGSILSMIIIGAALALILAVMLFRNEKATWVYRKIRGPDPGKSFLKDPDFQNWLSPHFTNQFFLSSMKLEDIASVEVVSTVDAVTLCSKEAPLLEKMRNESSSSFLNPSYSHLCPPACSLPTTANLEPCAGDTPHGASLSLGEGKNTEQDREEERMKERLQRLLAKGNNSEPVPVVSDYEKVEKLQVQCIRLQSLDSGMCSGEDVSEERMEADNISANESQDKGPKSLEEEKDGGNGQIDFQKLFGVSGSVFGKGSIQICSDYKPVEMLQPESPELPSLDSGVSSGGEERVSQEESLEDVDNSSESTHFLFPPPLASSALQHSGLTLPQQLLKFSGLSPALRPPSIIEHHRAGGMEPSGDGYMPARQEPC